jgi:hypothetical protein
MGPSCQPRPQYPRQEQADVRQQKICSGRVGTSAMMGLCRTFGDTISTPEIDDPREERRGVTRNYIPVFVEVSHRRQLTLG